MNFDRYSNFNPEANITELKFGKDMPVLEVELNEFQQIQNEQRKGFINEYLDSGLLRDLQIEFKNGSLITSNDTIAYVNGEKFYIPKNLVICEDVASKKGSPSYYTVFLETWKEEVTYQSTLTTYGATNKDFTTQKVATTTNTIKDSRYPVETSRRIVNKYRLRAEEGTLSSHFAQGSLTAPSTTKFAKDTTYTFFKASLSTASFDGLVYAIPLFDVTMGASPEVNYTEYLVLPTNVNMSDRVKNIETIYEGRNLLLNTGFINKDISKWDFNGLSYSVKSENVDGKDKNYIEFQTDTSSTITQSLIPIKAETHYTVSGFIKTGKVGSSLAISLSGTVDTLDVNTTKANEWTRFECTFFSLDDRVSEISFVAITKQETYALKDLKLEIGNKSTSYIEAPEDDEIKINSIEIGGRNYCEGLGGNYYDKKFIYSTSRQYATIEDINGKTWIKFTGFAHYVLRNIDIEPNTTYTWSFNVYADRDCNLITRQKDANSTYNRQEYSITTTPQKIVTTFTTRNDSTQEIFHLYATSSEVVYYCSDFKLEKGTFATDYTYSEDYMKTTVDGLVTKVDSNTSEINNMKESIIQNKPIVINDDSPVGTIVYRRKGQTLPSNWLYCDGSTISKTTYPELFAVIGYTYGGSDDNFKLPKLVLGNNLLVESSDSTNNHYVSEVLEQQGIIKVKSTSQDMQTVSQEWTNFKDNGGELGGDLLIEKNGVTTQLGYSSFATASSSWSVYNDTIKNSPVGVNLAVEPGQWGALTPFEDGGVSLGRDGYRFGAIKSVGITELTSPNNPNHKLKIDGRVIEAIGDSLALKSYNTDTLFFYRDTNTNLDYFMPSSDKVSLGTQHNKFKDVFVGNSQISGTGYTKLTNGLILQWGHLYMPNNVGTGNLQMTVNFPLAFPNGVFSVVGTLDSGEAEQGNTTDIYISAINTQFSLKYHRNQDHLGGALFWIAIGY